MQEINHEYLRNWSVTNKFEEIYHKPVCISGKLTTSVITEDMKEIYRHFNQEEYDGIYIGLINPSSPDGFPIVYIGSSLKKLLEKHGYIDYEGSIRVYGEFGCLSTTKTHIGKIWKAEILDETGNIVEVVE